MRYFFISLSIFVLISNLCSSEVIEYSNAKYSGDVVDGKEHGYGILTYDSGIVYKGEFKNGKKEGYGEIKWADGDTYKGQFKNGTCEGAGKLIDSDTTYYIGDFINCKRHGYGKQLFINDTTYWGLWANDEFEGLGYFKMPDLEYYGNWVDGNMHGFGIALNKKGDIWAGEFINDKMIDGKWIPNSEYKTWYSRLQKGKEFANNMEKNFVVINDLVKIADKTVEMATLKASEKLPSLNSLCEKNVALQTKYIKELEYEKLLNVAREFITLCSLEKPESVNYAYLSQINSLDELKRYEEIIPVANICIEQNKNFNICLLKKGLALYNLEKYQESKKAFEKTIAIGSYDQFSEIAVREATKWLKIIEKGGVLN